MIFLLLIIVNQKTYNALWQFKNSFDLYYHYTFIIVITILFILHVYHSWSPAEG